MRGMACVLLSNLLCTAASASFKVKEEHRTAFFGEDIHIDIPAGDVGQVVFRPKTNKSVEVPLLRAGKVLHRRARLNPYGHLVLDDVQEEDEGVYVVSRNEGVLRRLTLDVRDCAVEEVVKYGDTYYIHLNQVQGPISLEFRPGPVRHVNHSDFLHATEPPAALLFRHTLVLADAYAGRLSVTDKSVALHSVKMADEGSFTVRDHEGKVRRRNCLHVREHQDFLHPSNGADMTVKLYLDHGEVNVVYRPKSGHQDRPILERGVLVTPPESQLAGRVSVDGSELLLRKVRGSDEGVFKITDLAGFPVAHVYVDVVASKLPPLTLAVLSLLSLLAFMLLLCLLSCLYKVHKRNEKNKKLTLLAQQAGKGEEGEAFRQVVHEAYSRFTEESLAQSTCNKPAEDSDVTIKGVEVSKAGGYKALTSDTNFLEMSDSGVDSGLPPDSDTDATVTFASHKPLLDAHFPSPVSERDLPDGLAAATVPDGDVRTPVDPPTGDETAAEGGEAEQKEDASQST
ncbi:uncharacterized protein LOC109516382 isoform X1 [Hippocampus comes]|uniref:uncharacterized protein LOC109516382 isoform X1 n=1 Tax=Hippocampus comes TaxID=109280 RepID=UPI00094E538D|nr:PREDICTED: uncharacterized protein LOC109516382 isoform X1 [Hippocampus comes]